jgi:hypothetical protein
MADDEGRRIEDNLKVIRGYLARSFAGFKITEDRSNQRLWHTFTMLNRDTGEQVRLKIAWGRLSEESNTPDRTERSLEHGGVAGKMRNANGDYFYWGVRL